MNKRKNAYAMKKVITMLIALAAATGVWAQQDPGYSQYIFNQQFINPAYAGTYELANVTLLSRKQWWGFDGAPFSNFLSLDAPLNNINSGVGLLAVHDRIGVSTQTSLFLNYSYRIRLGGGRLSFGLRAGGTNYAADLSEVVVIEEGDAAYGSNISVLSPNFGAGLYYYTQRLFVGVSAPHLINYDEESVFNAPGIQDEFQQVRHYYFNAGYVITVSDNLMLRPSTMLRYVNDTPLQADINFTALISEVVWLGASYRTINTVIALAAVQVTPHFRVGYSYDFPISSVSRSSYGSHELMLSYDFGKQKEKIKTPRYF